MGSLHTACESFLVHIERNEPTMPTWELLIIAVGLSMDAFAVSICKGLSMSEMNYKNAMTAGCFFGGFQALMPILGYILGIQFRTYITSLDHWIAFVLLAGIGLKMIKESYNPECPASPDNSFSIKNITALAIATSIDALAVGITFAFLDVDILHAASIIGIITFIISFAGVKIGNAFGMLFQSKAEIVGGGILVAIGLKILLEHLGLIAF